MKLSEIPEEQRPKLISHTRRQFLNTIRMTAYRAETALVAIIREHLKRSDDARALAKSLFTHDADLIFDPDSQTLKVRLHHFANPLSSKAVGAVLAQLNDAEVDFPSTNIKLVYEMVSEPNPMSQDL
ncbi:MAG: putative transposase [Verrucomicrobiota bacterium]